jgi:phage N-6-adenine-methyltransferase
MPAQKPGRSVQEVGTPREFLDAVEKRFGKLQWDLAANADNHVTDGWYGPGSSVNEDSFSAWWHRDVNGLLWLNPPYANIGDWAHKCANEFVAGANILMLLPASIGTNYYRELVWPYAKTIALSPRLTFNGHSQSYPKDLVLAQYAPGAAGQLECWRWK